MVLFSEGTLRKMKFNFSLLKFNYMNAKLSFRKLKSLCIFLQGFCNNI